MSTLKLSPPMVIVIFIERCDSLFQAILNALSTDHDEQHFESSQLLSLHEVDSPAG